MAKSAADAAKKQQQQGDGVSPAPPDHNLPKGLAKLSRQDRAKLRLNHIEKMRPVRAKIAQATDLLKALRKELSPLRDAYKREGFSLANLDLYFAAEAKPRRDNQLIEQDRHELMEDTGQVVYQQPDLFERMPEEAKDEKFWSEEGYHAGICNKPPQAPDSIPPRFLQVWTTQYHAGREKVAWAMAEGGANPEDSRPDLAKTGTALEPESEDA